MFQVNILQVILSVNPSVLPLPSFVDKKITPALSFFILVLLALGDWRNDAKKRLHLPGFLKSL